MFFNPTHCNSAAVGLRHSRARRRQLTATFGRTLRSVPPGHCPRPPKKLRCAPASSSETTADSTTRKRANRQRHPILNRTPKRDGEWKLNWPPALAVVALADNIANQMKKLLLLLSLGLAITASAADKKIVFVAGKPSHRSGDHEHRAGSLLLKACLDNVPGVTSVVCSNGWPADDKAFEGAAAIVFYCDGGGGHPLLQGDRLKTIGALMDIAQVTIR